MPVGGYQIALYATWLVYSGRLKSASSVSQYVSAVRTLHRKHGLNCPTPSEYGPLDQVIKGVRRLAQRPTHQSRPVTPPILRNLLLTKPQNPGCALQTAITTSFRTLALLLFQSMLRSSNLVPLSRSSIDHHRILTWGSIQRVDYGIVISVRLSKTIQFSQRIQTIPLAACPTTLFCPVQALDTLANLYGHSSCTPNSPVFRLPASGGGWTPMIKSDFEKFFKVRISQMGLDASLYSLHGFRHGGIQECLLSEGNLGLCKVTSDHMSDAILVYSQVPANQRMQISAKINTSLATRQFESLA